MWNSLPNAVVDVDSFYLSLDQTFWMSQDVKFDRPTLSTWPLHGTCLLPWQ